MRENETWKDIKMPPLEDITDEGAERLLCAIYKQASVDYCRTKKYLIDTPKRNSHTLDMEVMNNDCKQFLGDRICKVLDKFITEGQWIKYNI